MTSAMRASGRSTLLTTRITGSRASSALRRTKRVCGSGPSLASTSSRIPSTMNSPRSTSPPKSAWPGVSMMLSLTSCVAPLGVWRTDVFFARIVMPFSRSRSIESMTRSFTSWPTRKAPDCHSIASTRVVLPWSTWATIATSRRSSLVGTTTHRTRAAWVARFTPVSPREQGMRTAIVCKSLFGKAHTVMAEGGIAAALGNVNANDDWQVHFRDTMRGGKFLNHWRMAELHAKEAPQRVWELETYGALFDRTKDGRISQRNFGGHEYPRLAHVGDRTGLELIRTLQQKIVALQQEDHKETGDYESRLKVFQECTVTRVLKDGDRVSGVFGYERES